MNERVYQWTLIYSFCVLCFVDTNNVHTQVLQSVINATFSGYFPFVFFFLYHLPFISFNAVNTTSILRPLALESDVVDICVNLVKPYVQCHQPNIFIICIKVVFIQSHIHIHHLQAVVSSRWYLIFWCASNVYFICFIASSFCLQWSIIIEKCIVCCNIQHDLHFHALCHTTERNGTKRNGIQWYIMLIYETHVRIIHVIFCII